MTRIFLADAHVEERSALRFLLRDLGMEVVGEVGDWPSALVKADAGPIDVVLVDAGLLPDRPAEALDKLRRICPQAVVVLLSDRLGARKLAARPLESLADVLIYKDEPPDYIADRLRLAMDRGLSGNKDRGGEGG